MNGNAIFIGTQTPLDNARTPTGSTQEGSISILQGSEAQGEVDAVIVTISAGSSYDALFSSVKQESQGGKVVVYQVTPGRVLIRIMRVLQGERLQPNDCSATEIELLNGLKKNCDEVGPEAVCFNFECCSHYSASFIDVGLHFEFISYLVKEYGCLAMLSDFSLKSLIRGWNEMLLGPCPISQVGEFSGKLDLVFNCETLKNCPSSQLVTVGKLCDDGKGHGSASLHALGGTIAYTLTKAASDTLDSYNWTEEGKRALPYEVEILTVASTLSDTQTTAKLMETVERDRKLALCHIKNGHRGLAGHVLITYPPSAANTQKAQEAKEPEPAKGRILTSCGHWIELMKIDTNVARLLEVAKQEYGENSTKYQSLMGEVEKGDAETRTRAMNAFSANMIQSKAPQAYKKKS